MKNKINFKDLSGWLKFGMIGGIVYSIIFIVAFIYGFLIAI